MIDLQSAPPAEDVNGVDGASVRLVERSQSRVSALLLATMVFTAVGFAGLAHFEPLLHWMELRQLAIWRGQNALYAHNVEFADADDRLLLQDIYRADFRHGGVYFIGSSTTRFAMANWLLPSEERKRIHNFALKSANYFEQFKWVQYLVEQKRLLQAGPGRNLVVLGLDHLDTRPKLPGTSDWNYIPELFKRHGLHTYDTDRGIGDALSGPLAWLQRERMRSHHVLRSLLTHSALPVRPPHPDSGIDPREISRARAVIHRLMGGEDWSIHMDRQLEQLRQMILYLMEHGTQVEAVMMPLASWNRGFPEAEAFDRRVKEMLSTVGVRINDLQWACPDSQFFDMTHLNARGQQVITPLLAQIGMRFLNGSERDRTQ